MASAIAVRLYRANIRRICMLDLEKPLCVRRQVSFCPALLNDTASVEGISAGKAADASALRAVWAADKIAVMLVSDWDRMESVRPDVVIDAILAKRNLGTTIKDAGLVVALGPGFNAGVDCHRVIETNRGHDLGRIIETGPAAPDTGVPGAIAGETRKRILRAPCDGVFHSQTGIGDFLKTGQIVGHVQSQPVVVEIDGMIRGLIQTGTQVSSGLKIGDIDPRGQKDYCASISEKARSISGAVLECVVGHVNRATA
jgi:xanthine dehydrogenase accessory factor